MRLGLDAGHVVVAVTRRPDDFGEVAPQLRIVGADVTDLGQVEEALHGAEAVISTIGVNPSRRPVNTYSTGIANITEAMQSRGVTRIVAVSSKSLTVHGVRGEPLLYRVLVSPLLHTLNRTIYQDMRRMERLLAASDRDWTVMRPAGLFAADQVSAYRCTAGHEPGVYTSTVDLADALIAETVTSQPSVGSFLEVLTDANTPTLPALIAGQAALHRR